jgi:hypothetical protein
LLLPVVLLVHVLVAAHLVWVVVERVDIERLLDLLLLLVQQ